MMEGDGAKGLVTILQNLDNREVVIALGNGQRDQANGGQAKSRLAAVKPFGSQKSSVHTNTDRARNTTISRHAQISDDRFTSCYQVAHCSVSPTSPPLPPTEFPPQRPNPAYNEGNFEVGGQGSWQSSGPCRASHFRGGLTWPDRGSVYCNKSSRDIDTFADSLRKYPPESPERTVSAELVERLLRYTQAKYAQKTAKTKSMRSLSNDKSPDRRVTRNQSKHLQTITRAQNTSRRSVSPSRRGDYVRRRDASPSKKDRGTASEDLIKHEQRQSRKRSRDFSPRSPVRERDVDEEEFDAKYDYLKAGRRDPQGSEQLRMDEIGRHVRNVIRQFYNPTPVVFQVCPKIQKRYIQHKKTCPVRNSSTWMSGEDDDTGDEASSSTVSRFFKSIGVTCEGASNTDLVSSKRSEQESFCQCAQTPKCHCEPKTVNDSEDKSVQSNVRYKCKPGDVLCKDSCECIALTDEAYYNSRIDDEVAKWMNTIPVESKETFQDKTRREYLVTHLAETLKLLPDDADFEANARDAIERCVADMPMWCPGTKQDGEQIKRQLVETLLDTLTTIPRKPDKLRDVVKDFINSLKFEDDVDKNEIVDNFVKKLKFLGISAPKDSEIFKEILTKEGLELLEQLPLQFHGNKNVILKTLAKKLADDAEYLLKNIDASEERTGDDSLKYKFKDIISKWFKEVGEANENLPKSDELQRIINDLASSLDSIQSQGVDEIAMHKMETIISKILDDLDTPVENIDDLTNNLMDNVTDAVYVKEKDKLERMYKQETFTEFNNWLKNVPDFENLDPVEQYKLVREIAEKELDSIDQNDKDYQDDILPILTKFNIHIDPVTLSTQLDEIANRLKLLPEKLKKEELIANLKKEFNDVVDKSNIPEIKKNNLKDRTGTIIAENIAASSLATQRDIDGMRETLLEQIYENIQDLPDTVQNDLKNKLNDFLDKHINKIQLAKDKDAVKYALLKEMNYAIDKEPIPEDEKNDIKYNIKNIINDNFDQPFSYHVKDHIKAHIVGTVADSEIDKDRKDNLTTTLINVVDTKLDELPKQSMKDHVKNKTFKDMCKVINKSEVSEDVKDTMKQKLKYMLNHNFDQPFSADIKDAIINDINKIIDQSAIPRSLKHDLIRKLTHNVDKSLDELPDQTTIDHTKENIVKDITEFMENISLPKEQLNDLKNKLELTIAEFLDRPYTRDRRDKLNETLNNIIQDSEMPSDLKESVIDKLIQITGKNLDQLAYQTPEEYARETIMRDMTHVLNELSLTTDDKEKKDLVQRLETLVDEGLRSGYLDEGRDVIKKGLVDIIRESSAPQHKQDDFIFKSLHAVSKILDESYYEDYDRQQLKEFYDMIDTAKMRTAKKNILKPKTKKIVDDHTLDPEYGTVKDVIKEAIDLVEQPSQLSISGQEVDIDESVIDEITNSVRTAPISEKKRVLLEDNLNKLVEKLSRQEDVDKTIVELEKTIEEIPLPSHDKKALKSKLAMMVTKDSDELNEKLKSALIKDLESAVDLISLGKEKESDLKFKLRNLVENLDEPVFGNVKDKIKNEAFDIIDKAVYSKDRNNQLKSRITNIVDKLPTQRQDVNLKTEKLVSRIDNIVDETPIRQHIKDDIKSQIRETVSDHSKQPSKKKTKDNMKTDINNIINEAPITEYQKRALKHKITKVLDPLPEMSSDKNTIFENVNKLLDDESLSKVKKTELKKKIQENLSDLDESTPNYVKSKKIKDVLKAIDDTVLPKDKKASLKAKLEHELTKNIENLTSSSKPKYNVLESLSDSISKELDNAFIPQSTKSYLKKRMNVALSKMLQQPMSKDLEKSINTEFSNILDEVALSNAEKDILKNNVANTISEKVGEPRSNIETAAIKNNLMKDINLVLDDMQIPRDKKQELQFQFQDLLNELTEKPVTSKTLKLVDKEIKNIIADAPISKEKKAEVQNKFGNIIEHSLKPLSLHYRNKYEPQTDEKAEVMDEIDSIIDQLQINTFQKEQLKHKLNDSVEKTLNKPIDNDTIVMLKDDIYDIIAEAPIPKDKKTELRKQLSSMVDNKVKDIDRRKANVDSEWKPSEFSSKAVKDNAEKISTSVRLQQPYDKKTWDAFNITDDSKPISEVRAVIVSGIDSILDPLQINNNNKNSLRDQLYAIVDENLEKPINSDTMLLINNGIRDIILEAPLPRNKKTEIQKKLSDMIDDKVAPFRHKNIGVDNRRNGVKVKINTGDSSKRDRSKIKSPDIKDMNAVHEEIDSVVGQLKIPHELKSVLKQQLKVKAEETPSSIDSIKAPARQLKQYSNMANKSMKNKKDAIMEDIDSILDKVQISSTQKNILKGQLKDMVNDNFEKPINNDTLRVIKNNINNIISEASIPTDKKTYIRSQMIDMVDDKIESSSDTNMIFDTSTSPSVTYKTKTKYPEKKENAEQKSKQISDTKTEVTKEISTVINQLEMNNYQKENLKHLLNSMVNENLEKPIDKDTVANIKHKINDIMSKAPIPKHENIKIVKRLDDMVDDKVAAVAENGYRYEPVSDINETVIEYIDDIVDQLEISSDQKDNLKFQLNEAVGENLEIPIDTDKVRFMKKTINDVISKAPLSKAEKMTLTTNFDTMVDNKMESVPGKSTNYKYKPRVDLKPAIKADIDLVIDQLDINSTEKYNLKRQINDTVSENLQKPIDSHRMRHIRNKINDIVDKTHIPKDKKLQLAILADVVEDKLKLMPGKIVEPEYKQAAEIKTAITEDIGSVIDQLDINNYQKNNLKRQLNEIVDLNLEKPVDKNTMTNIKNKINDVISKAPIAKDIKLKTKKKIVDIVNSNIETLSDKSVNSIYKSISETKETNSKLIESTVDELDLDDTEKNNLKQKLNDMFSEYSETSINKDTIKDIISKTPIPKYKKAYVIKKLADMLDNKLQPISSDNIDSRKSFKIRSGDSASDSNQLKSISPDQIKNIMQDVDSVLDQIQIPNDQKRVLKRNVTENINKNLDKPFVPDMLDVIKEDIKNTIAKAPISRNKKGEIGDILSNVVESHLKEPKPVVEVKYNVSQIMSEFESDLEELQIPSYEKNKMRYKLKNMINENSQLPPHVIKHGISDIIADADIPKHNKAELINKLSSKVKHDTIVSESSSETSAIDHKKKYKREADFMIDEEMYSSNGKRDTKREKVFLKHEVLQEIDDVLETLEMSSAEKLNMKTKLNDKLSKYSEKPMPIEALELLKADINNIIAKTPMDTAKKKDLKNKIHQKLNERSESFTGTDYSNGRYKKTEVAALRYENPSTSRNKGKPFRSRQNSRSPVTYDADDEVTRDETLRQMPSNKNEPSTSRNGKRKSNESHEYLDEDDVAFADQADDTDTSNIISKNISGILNDIGISKQKKKDLRGQVKRVLKEENSKSDLGMGHQKMLEKTESVIFGLPLPDHIKEMMLGKLGMTQKKPVPGSAIEDSFSPSVSRIPSAQRGFATSTPKKRRKSWEEPDTFSSLADDDITKEVNEYWTNINDCINDWLDSLPTYIDDETKKAIREGIAKDIKDRQDYLKLNPGAMKSLPEELKNLQYQVMRRLSKVLDEDDMKLVMEAAGDLMQIMNAVEVPTIMTEMIHESDITDWESPEEVRNKLLHWIDTLPLERSVKNSSNFQKLKKDLVSNLTERLEELNNDPEIFNNDALYEDMLSDEIDKLISELPIDPDTIIKEKESLIKQLMARKRTIRGDKVGTTYKQQLEDSICNTLPVADGSPDELATFELMKGDVADAFISLHYSGGNEEQRKKFKKRINDQVTKYCDDYLNKHPNEPVNSVKLAEDLYAALKSVPVPLEESMKLEEEQIRLKDVVKDWMKQLPLKELTAEKQLQVARDISKLAIKLKDTERNDAQLSDSAQNMEMRNEITKFLKTLPFKPGQERNINNFAKQLITKLRSTRSARRVDDSTRYSISLDDTLRPLRSSFENDGVCPYYKSLLERQKQLSARRRSTCTMRPPCTLSDEDREHLERIRQRTCMTPDCLSALLRGAKRNSSVNPIITETGSQTEQNLGIIGQRISFQPCPSTDINDPRPCPGITPDVSKQVCPPLPARGQFVESGSQIEIQPQIIIKEYYWDTVDSTEVPAPGSRHSTGSLRRRYTVPCAQPAPCSEVRPRQCIRPQNKSLQTCQDRRDRSSLPCTSSPYIPQICRSRPSLSHPSPPCDPSPCSSRPCSPRPCTPRPYTPRPCNSPLSQSFIPHLQSTPRNSFGQFYRGYDYDGPKRNGLQEEYPEYSGSRYSRKERVIELGSLDDLRNPSQRKRSEDCDWCSHFPEDDFWGTPSRHDLEDEYVPCNMPYVREKKEERMRCKCKEKLMMNIARRRPRQQCQKHSTVWSECVDNNRKGCSRCFGSHCPYPSYMYFQQ